MCICISSDQSTFLLLLFIRLLLAHAVWTKVQHELLMAFSLPLIHKNVVQLTDFHLSAGSLLL